MPELAGHPQDSSRGQALVEFALVLLALVMLVFGVFEFGRGMYANSALANAAREGARYGVISPADTAGIKAKVVAQAVGLTIPVGNVTVSFPDGASTAGSRIRVDVSYNFQSETPLVSPNLTLSGSSTMIIQ